MRTAICALGLVIILGCGETPASSQNYRNLSVIDVHNHDSYKYKQSLPVWDRYHINKIVLFGAISEPQAVKTDRMAWEAYTEYPDRFLVSSDSGFDVGYDNAYKAVYELFDKLDYSVVEKIAYKNFQALIEAQPVTKTQRAIIRKLAQKKGIPVDADAMNKRRANEWIIKYQAGDNE